MQNAIVRSLVVCAAVSLLCAGVTASAAMDDLGFVRVRPEDAQ